MTEEEARAWLEESQENLRRWSAAAREFDEAIIALVGIRSTMVPTAFHDMGRVAIGRDLARIIWARWRGHRDYGTSSKQFRGEMKRMRKAAGWYLLACLGIASMKRATDYVYAGRPQSRLSVVPAR
jgi:hypothetical protein